VMDLLIVIDSENGLEEIRTVSPLFDAVIASAMVGLSNGTDRTVANE